MKKFIGVMVAAIITSVAIFGFSPAKAVSESYIMVQDWRGGFAMVDPETRAYTPLVLREDVRAKGWSLNGRYFAFSEGEYGNNPTVRVYDFVDRQELPFVAAGQYEGWHPDGRLILKTGETETSYQYAAANVQTGTVTSFSYGTPALSTHHTYSPDGTKLAFVDITPTTNEEPPALTVRTLANGQDQIVQTISTSETQMAWSLNGQVLAFQFRTGWRHQIGVMTATGAVINMTSDLTTTHVNPTLSPDGSEVVFSRYVPPVEDGEDGYFEVIGRQITPTGPGAIRTILSGYRSNDYYLTQFWRPVAEPEPIVDTDGDGTPNSTDECDSQPGPASNHGCPIILHFEWTAPDRLQADPNGLITNYPAIATQHPGVVANPTQGVLVDYPINFHVTANNGEPCSPAHTYTWKVNGTPVAMQQSGCDFAFRFPEEKNYSVTVESTDGQFTAIPHSGEVKINDYLIFSIGDSVASGEGNPHSQGVWAYAPCHRSSYAGATQAALKLEKEDNKSSVTFVHLACSGATAAHGVFGTYKGLGGQLGTPLPSQIQQIAMATGATPDAQGIMQPKRKIDKLFMSIGANDIGFSPIARTCLTSEDCPTQVLRTVDGSATSNTYWRDIWGSDPEILPGDTLSAAVRRKLNKLPNGYRAIDACLGTGTTLASCITSSILGANYRELLFDQAYRNAMLQNAPVAMNSSDIIVSHYFDPTKHQSDGEIVACDPVIHFVNQVLSKSEGEWASQFVLRGPNVTHRSLNEHITAAATQYGWGLIDGVAEAFEPYGYCAANQSWIVSIGEALLNSSGPAGALHPNELGQAYYGDRMYSKLQ